MTGYTKLFGSIVASTIWRESPETKVVWITMLAMANKNGIVEASIPGLADMSRVTVAECQEALDCFLAPDEFSRTKDYEGKRIAEVDGGWQILNHAKYRKKMNTDERREYLKLKQREYRAKAVDTVSTNVDNCSDLSTRLTHAEAEAKAKATNTPSEEIEKKVRQVFVPPTMEEVLERSVEIGLPEVEAKAFWFFYDGKGWMQGKNKMQRWRSALSGWKNRKEASETLFQKPTNLSDKASMDSTY